ncbi:DUF2946 domain-containing protein [Flavobacterium longum]|uniref:hypothetical protein n=1 Tax=Flavobacterium longum TaxID=1299340 RepID=UPI0039EAE976
MKNKLTIWQFFLTGAFLFAVLYPSLDGLHHLEKEMSVKHCEHQYAVGKTEVNHSHHGVEKCYSCEFTFSQFLSAPILSFSHKIPFVHSAYAATYTKDVNPAFRGSLFAHRGPPSLMMN